MGAGPACARVDALDIRLIRQLAVEIHAVGQAQPRFDAQERRAIGLPQAEVWEALKADRYTVTRNSAAQRHRRGLNVLEHGRAGTELIMAERKLLPKVDKRLARKAGEAVLQVIAVQPLVLV